MSTSEVVRDVLWTERYRPKALADLAVEEQTRTILQSYVDAGEIPHLCLVGPPGSGKTTVARILIKALDCISLPLNASAERGIDTVREKIGAFATAIMGRRWNIVFLDEADAMTSDAQTAMRNLMESYAERTRFILTANYEHRIIEPIKSRCQLFTLGRPPLRERARILISVLKQEGVEASPQTVVSYAERYPDMRRMLMAAQKAWLSARGKPLAPATEAGLRDGKQLLDALLQKNWMQFRSLTTQGDFDTLQALRDLFWAIPNDHAMAGFMRHKIGRGVHEMGFTPDPIILFLGVIAEVMEGL